MIWHPHPGQRVELHYRQSLRSLCPHLSHGTVEIAGRGRGPLNALVLLDDGRRFVVPRGNMEEVTK